MTMKTLKTSALLIGMAFTIFATAQEKDTKYALDTKVSKMEWVGKKVTGQHNGTIKIKEGYILVDKKGNITGGQVIVDMNTIECLDLEGEWKQKLEGHLKSKDFFEVENYPTATFEIISATPDKSKGKNNYIVKGKLTIKGISKEISFPAKIEFKDNNMAAHGKATIDRTEFNIKYGSGKFFEGLGDKMIYDDFEVSFTIAARKR